MRRFTLAVIVAGTLVIGVVVGAATKDDAAKAAGARAAAKCSKASLKGAYGVSFDGTSKALGRFASVSLWKFDGKGKLHATEAYNSEQTGPQRRAIDGSYTVGADCRFRLLFGSELVHTHQADGLCVLVANRREFSCLDFEDGWQTIGTGTKVSP